MTEKKKKAPVTDGEILESGQDQVSESVLPFDDYSSGQVVTVPLEGISRKGAKYRVFHKMRIPDNVQMRKFNNRLTRIEETLGGRGQRKGRTKVNLLVDRDGACEWLWDQVIVDVTGYPGGRGSVPIDHKRRAIEAVLPEIGGLEVADEQE